MAPILKPIQLELNRWVELRQAELAPEKSEVRQLCLHLEQAIAAPPPEQQLSAVGATAVVGAESGQGVVETPALRGSYGSPSGCIGSFLL